MLLYLHLIGDYDINVGKFTPLKTNMSPQEGPFQKESSLLTTIFSGDSGDMLILGGVPYMDPMGCTKPCSFFTPRV